MFDANCIRECLLNYEASGLDYVHEKNIKINELFLELGYIEKSSFDDVNKKKKIAKTEEEKITTDLKGMANDILNKLKFKKQENNDDKLNINDEKRKEIEKELNDILSEQCVLCGDYMVDSIQCSVSKPILFKTNKDGFKMNLNNPSSWDYLE